MKRLPGIFFLIAFSLFFTTSVEAFEPQSGSSTVNASVSNPSQTPTPTPTPTPVTILTSTPTPTPTPTPIPGVSGTPTGGPTPTLGPTGAPGETVNLDISGYASPHASVIMTTNGVFVRSTVADSKGNFYLSQIGVKVGFTDFCLENIDFQRIGDSLTCFKIAPVIRSTSKTGIFLPPSLGLSSKKTTPMSYIYAFGYTMPGSDVDLKITEDENLKTKASNNGYYKVKVDNLAVGTYELYAAANYQGNPSVKPSKTQELKSLTPAQAAREEFFTSLWGFLLKYGWIAIPILILIFILLSKRLRDRIRNVIKTVKDRGEGTAPKGTEHLHHYYLVGF